MFPRPAATDRHLAILDELAEIGMVLVRRLVDLPPLTGQDTGRDFEIISRAVRRSILLWHIIADDKIPTPAAPHSGRGPERDPATPSSGRERSDAGTRLDAPDRLDDVSAPFEHVVTAIIDDIRTALRTSHGPVEPALAPSGTIPDRPEADVADLL